MTLFFKSQEEALLFFRWQVSFSIGGKKERSLPLITPRLRRKESFSCLSLVIATSWAAKLGQRTHKRSFRVRSCTALGSKLEPSLNIKQKQHRVGFFLQRKRRTKDSVSGPKNNYGEAASSRVPMIFLLESSSASFFATP